jgi:hypothetical protein
MLNDHPDLAPWRPPVGITPRLSDAELVTLATTQAMLGYTSEAKWLCHGRAHLRHLFPYLPQQPGYNERLRKAAGLMRSVNGILATTTSVWSDDVWAVDSTPWNALPRETVKRSDLAGGPRTATAPATPDRLSLATRTTPAVARTRTVRAWRPVAAACPQR